MQQSIEAFYTHQVFSMIDTIDRLHALHALHTIGMVDGFTSLIRTLVSNNTSSHTPAAALRDAFIVLSATARGWHTVVGIRVDVSEAR